MSLPPFPTPLSASSAYSSQPAPLRPQPYPAPRPITWLSRITNEQWSLSLSLQILTKGNLIGSVHMLEPLKSRPSQHTMPSKVFVTKGPLLLVYSRTSAVGGFLLTPVLNTINRRKGNVNNWDYSHFYLEVTHNSVTFHLPVRITWSRAEKIESYHVPSKMLLMATMPCDFV